MLGYFVPVEPAGFVVVSLRRELEPVKAYSDESDLDTAVDVGPAALIKDGMARILDAVETEAGSVACGICRGRERVDGGGLSGYVG